MNHPILQTFQAVKGWFFDNKRAKFTLYATHSNDAKHSLLSQESDEMTLLESWNLLEKFLDYYLWTGDFYLYVTSSKNMTGGGKNTLIRLWGKYEAPPNTKQNNENAAINGTNAASINGFVSKDEIKGLLEEGIAVAMLRRDNDELRATIAAGLSPTNGLFAALEHPTIKGLIEDISEVWKYQKINQNGVKTAEKQPRNTEKQPKRSANTEGEKEYKLDKMFSVFQKTETLFSGHEPQDVHAALFQVLDNAPKMYRDTIFQSIEQQLKNNAENE